MDKAIKIKLYNKTFAFKERKKKHDILIRTSQPPIVPRCSGGSVSNQPGHYLLLPPGSYFQDAGR